MKQNIHSIIYKPLFMVLILFFIVHIGVNTYFHYEKFEETKNQIEKNILKGQKDALKNKVDFIVSEIEPTIQSETQKVVKHLKDKVETAYNIAEHIYTINKNNPEVLNLVKESLRQLRFHDIGDQFVFMTRLDGTLLLLPGLTGLEGVNLFKSKSVHNNTEVRNIIKMVKTKKQGYYEYDWQNHITLGLERKISYFKYFEPFDAYIGTGVFKSDIEDKLKEVFIEDIEKFKHGDKMQNYFFAATYDGFSLTGPMKGTNVLNSSNQLAAKLIRDITKVAQEGGGFISYELPIKDGEVIEKLSYVKGIDNWNMYVGTGEELEDIQRVLAKKKAELTDELYKDIAVTSVFSFIFFVLLYVLLNNLKSKLTKEIKNITKSFESLLTNNEKIDIKPLNFYEFEMIATHSNDLLLKKNSMEEELKDKEVMLFHQSKMAAMGEMMENIAHQWRQPLSLITTESSSTILKQELNITTPEGIIKSMESIISSSEYLSNTIDDFRNFFKKDKEKVEFEIDELLNKTLNIIDSKMKYTNIAVELDIQKKKVFGYENELIQVLLVLLNNSKDVLEDFADSKVLYISAYHDDTFLYIQTLDNGGGVSDSIANKIFDPYFTTKHQSKGTGIGLYMANQIIVNHMGGELSVKNKTFTFKDKQYTGAQFTIKIPL